MCPLPTYVSFKPRYGVADVNLLSFRTHSKSMLSGRGMGYPSKHTKHTEGEGLFKECTFSKGKYSHTKHPK